MSSVAELETTPAEPAEECSPPEVRPPQAHVATLFTLSEHRVFIRTNRLFRFLLAGQWVLGIAVAAALGEERVGLSIVGVVLLGAIFTVPAFVVMRWMPFEAVTRAAVALSQMGFGFLAIQMAGGRPESHFHLFASLAFLSLYRDWRVLPVATLAVVVHHLAVGRWLPGVAMDFSRLLVDGGWLLFESLALGWACVDSRREMREICQRQDENQRLLAELEQRVAERTRALQSEMEARARTAEELHKNQQQHLDLVARVPIGIFETTRHGGVRYANPHLLSLIGLPARFDPTAISLADGRIFPRADRDRLWARLDAEKEVRGFAATLHHFDGSSFEVMINARLRQGAPGEEPVCEGTVEDVTGRKRTERELDALHSQLVVASRQAGMAEVATGVLHNVGNVLTSVNLIVHDVQDRLKTTRLTHLQRVVDVLQREKPRLGEFLTGDSAGRQLPDFLDKLNAHLAAENKQLLGDVEGLVRHFEHIREIIVTQQGSAQLFGVMETLSPAQLFEDALRLSAESIERHGIALERNFEEVGTVKADRHKVLQILVNLLKNAKDALQSVQRPDRRVRVRVHREGPRTIALSVADNGPGIAPENLRRIFQHGFTTKPTGHGFGLHSSVLAAREMGGDLTAASEGPGRGSTFTLTLPFAKDAAT